MCSFYRPIGIHLNHLYRVQRSQSAVVSPRACANLLRFTLLLGVTWLSACSNHAEVSGEAPVISFRMLKSAEPLALQSIGKPLLVNFWSTSCGLCLKEMPELAETYEEYAPRGFEMIAVAMPSDRPDAVLEMTNQQQWPFKVALDIDSAVVNAFGDVRFTPTSFLIDADGRFVKKIVGKIDLVGLKKDLDIMLGS